MTLGLIGQKIGMTQVFTEEGIVFPVTVIAAGPCTVVTKKTVEKHGYNALQLGFGSRKESRTSLPLRGQFKKANVPPCRTLKEFRVTDIQPFEVGQQVTVDVFFVGETGSVVKARGNFLVYPHYTFEHHPDIDVLMVVGGIHSREVENAAVIDWISTVSVSAKWVVSVCTGAFLLAEAGLLNGLSVTTHWEDIPDLRSQYPKLNVIDNQRWVSEGRFITSAGISAGIDMSLFLVAQMASHELAKKTARQMEYEWAKNG